MIEIFLRITLLFFVLTAKLHLLSMKNEKNGKLISECERNSVILQPTWEKVEG